MAVNRAEFQVAINAKTEGTGSTKELHEALRLLKLQAGEALGPIGELGHFLANPYMLAMAGATLAIKMFAENLERQHEETLKNIEASREQAETLRDAVTSATETAADALNRYEIRVTQARQSVDLLTEALNRNLAHIHEHESATSSLAGAQEHLNEAYIRAAQVSGQITAPQADAMVRHAHEVEQRARDAAEDAAREAEAVAHHNRAVAAAEQVNASEASLPGLRQTAEEKQAQLNYAEKELERRRKVAQADATAADQAHADLGAGLTLGSAAYALVQAGFMPNDALRNIKEKAATAAAQAAKSQSEVDVESATVKRYERELAKANENMDAAEKLAESSRRLAEEQNRLADEIRQMSVIHQQGHAAIERANDQSTTLERLSAIAQQGGAAPGMSAAELSAANGPSVSFQALQALEARARQVNRESGSERQSDIEQILGTILGLLDQLTLHPMINGAADIRRRLENIEGQLSQSRGVN